TKKMLLAFTTAFFISSCASVKSQKEQFVEVDKKVEAQDFSSAAMVLEASKDKYYAKKDRVLYYLDEGMLYHYQPSPEKSNDLLTRAEDAIDELYTNSISKGAASLLLNDNVMDYDGEDYEDVYLNVFKALNYLSLNQFDPAFVEIRRINNKLSALEEKYNKIADEYNKSEDAAKKFTVAKNKFNNSALGRYLSMLMYRADGKYDDARIDLEKIDEAWSSQSQLYTFPKPDFKNYLEKTTKAKVNVVSFVGKAPRLYARNLTIHTFKDAIAIYVSDGKKEEELEVIPWPKMTSGYHFKFSLPYMEKQGTKIARVTLELNGGLYGDLQTIESLENAAEDTYKLKEGITYLKTIIRTVTKGILNEKANVELDKKTGGGLFGELTRIATSALVDVSENADLRLARYFPAKALVGEFEVAPGTYSVTVKYFAANGQLLFADERGRVVVKEQGLNLVQSAYLN
ncbi:MAG: hypothetical protein PHP42_11500, partial [Bacteroidota bacterium]|nr:hypothetical protein [Bacteroidota bacterium]